MVFVYIFIAILLLYVAYQLGQFYYLRWKRSKELSRYAEENEWDFGTNISTELQHHYLQFHAFNKGENRFTRNTIRGSFTDHDSDWLFVTGDFHYSDKSWHLGTSPTGQNVFSYILLRTPFESIDGLLIKQEDFSTRFSAYDIAFESIDFNDKYFISCSSKRFAYDLIDQQMIEFLMRSEPSRVEIRNGFCLIFSEKDKWRLQDFKRSVAWMREFCSRWPRYLVSDMK